MAGNPNEKGPRGTGTNESPKFLRTVSVNCGNGCGTYLGVAELWTDNILRNHQIDQSVFTQPCSKSPHKGGHHVLG